MMRTEFARQHEAEHLALIAALRDSACFCDQPENRERVIEALAQPEYTNAPIQAIRMSLGRTFDYGNGRVEKTRGQHIFYAGNANEPTAEKAMWVIENMIRSGTVPDATLIPVESTAACFRADIFQQATQLIAP